MASERSRLGFVIKRLGQLRKQHLYRSMKQVVARGSTAVIDGKEVVHLCSNDYLGLANNRSVVEAARSSLKEISQCSSRLIAGNHPIMCELETALASHRKAGAALVFPTGYMANLGALTALTDHSMTIISDELNHASVIDACKLSGAKVKVFRHNDIDHLEVFLRKLKGKKVVVTEGVFSMDGDISKLREICRLSRRHGALTVVDDAHGDFVFGNGYSGVPSLLGADVDVHVSSLSKALGCFGGYVAAPLPVIDLLVNVSRPFIYTSALPQHLCAAALQAMKLAKRGHLQARLLENVAHFSRKLRNAEFVIDGSASQIIPVKIGSEKEAMRFSKELLDAGFFSQAIRYPTVRKGEARLRLSVTAAHKTHDLGNAVDALTLISRKNRAR